MTSFSDFLRSGLCDSEVLCNLRMLNDVRNVSPSDVS